MSEYADRLRVLAAGVDAARESLDPDPPDEERALELLREGFGPTVALYCEARTGDEWVRFGDRQFDRLEATMNDWLDLYAACYGVDLDGAFTVREAAELLIDTRSVRDAAMVLTGVPDRR